MSMQRISMKNIKVKNFDKIIYLHLMKCAGSDLVNQLFTSHLGKYFFPSSLRSSLLYLSQQDLSDYRFYYEHELTANEIAHIQGDKFLFTFFRNPIERVISLYQWIDNYKLQLDGANSTIAIPVGIPIQRLTPREFFESEYAAGDGFSNYMLKSLFGSVSNKKTQNLDLMFERVIRFLDEEIDFIGTVDNYIDSIEALSRLLDVYFVRQDVRQKINVTKDLGGENSYQKQKKERDMCKEAGLYEKISTLNSHDIELYKQAVKIAEKRFGIAHKRKVFGLFTQGEKINGFYHTYAKGGGWLLFGPYEKLDAGKYEVVFTLRANAVANTGDIGDSVVFLDVVADVAGSKGVVLGCMDVKVKDIRDDFNVITLPFDLSLPALNVEYRVYSTGCVGLDAVMSVDVNYKN